MSIVWERDTARLTIFSNTDNKISMKKIVNKLLKDRRLWIITIIAFVLLITVLDKNNLLEVWHLKQEIKALEVQKSYYQERITQDSTILENLKTDHFLEQYARENYLMKREKEVIYVIK